MSRSLDTTTSEEPPTGVPVTAEVGVIGAGAMGLGIAQLAAQAGHRVHLFDTRMGAADEAAAKIAQTLATLAAKGKLDAGAASAAAARVIPVHALGDFVSAKLVVEAVVEDLEIKRQLFRELEVVVTADTILATNTSSFSITALAVGMRHPERVVGMHFFNPAPVMPLVEVVRGLATSTGVAQTTYATAVAWGKLPVHAQSTPGFIVNRCARPYYGEALRLLTERAADPATIDALMREAGGFRMGPFELMDLVGLDVNYAVTRSVWEAFFHDPRYAPSLAQQELVIAGFLGRKTGRGFYSYALGASRPPVSTEAPQPRPVAVRAAGDGAMSGALRDRLAASGFNVVQVPADPAVAEAYLEIDGVLLVPSDGRTATMVAAASARPEVVVFDLALDYRNCTRLAIAVADSCSAAGAAAAIGALQAAGMAVTRIDDVAGLVVLRTVAMLATEAADAVTQGIAAPADIDLAMCKGVNYPRGPLAWADAIGLKRVRSVLHHLAAHYGEDRYRVSPLITRRCAIGGSLVN